ncbi:MAG: segregation/condensation protein A [Oscillospiraceae bacterium]|jgi:segregation and condensation protein A|nr:segregation/condensation protein A [Oscillospiraceae bacterium]
MFNVKTETYQGSMELLCRLIEKNKLNIYDIPISLLADQYIEIVNEMESDMEGMSEFLLLASELLEIKARLLIPSEKTDGEEEEDPREKLARRIEEYRKYKSAAELLALTEDANEFIFFKSFDTTIPEVKTELKPEEALSGITIPFLYAAFREIINRRSLRTDKIRAGFSSVSHDNFTVEEKSLKIIKKLQSEHSVSFASLFVKKPSKQEEVTTFLALLELVRSGKIFVIQDTTFGDIILSLKGVC